VAWNALAPSRASTSCIRPHEKWLRPSFGVCPAAFSQWAHDRGARAVPNRFDSKTSLCSRAAACGAPGQGEQKRAGARRLPAEM